MSEKRTCTKCNIEKEFNITNFRNKYGKPMGKSCRDCYNKSRIKYDKYRYKNEKEKRSKDNKIWRNENKSKISLDRKIYYKNNKEKIKKYKRKYMRNKRQNDNCFKLNSNFSCLIYQSLRQNKNGKRWEDIVGYTVGDLKNHLESLWEPWMNWDNYGKYDPDGPKVWQIDHIVPKSWFKYTSYEDEEFKKCWALSNLQPKEGKANIIKSNNHIG